MTPPEASTAPPIHLLTQVVANNLAFWQKRLAQVTEAQYAQLKAEQANLLRAVWFGQRLPTTRAAASKLMEALVMPIEYWGTWPMWLAVIEALLAEATEPVERAFLLETAGLAHRRQQALAPALAYYKEAADLMWAVNNLYEFARLQQGLCDVYVLRHEYAAAAKAGETALDIFTEIGYTRSPQAAATHSVLGRLAQMQGQWTVAETHYATAADLWSATEYKIPLARALSNQAMMLHFQKRFAEALQVFDKALVVLATTDSDYERTNILITLGTILFEQGDVASAEARFLEADSDWLRQTTNSALRGLLTNNLGNVYLAQGRLAEAETSLQGAAQLFRQAEDNLNLANALGALGETLVRQGRGAEAQPFYTQSLQLSAQYPTNAFAQRLKTKYGAQAAALQEKLL